MSQNQLIPQPPHKPSKSLDLRIICTLHNQSSDFQLVPTSTSPKISSSQSSPSSPSSPASASSQIYPLFYQVPLPHETYLNSPNFLNTSTLSNPSSPSSPNFSSSPQFKSPFHNSCKTDQAKQFCQTCKQCLSTSKTYKILSQALHNEKDLLEKSNLVTREKVKKTNNKLKSRITDLESVITKIKHSCKFTSESLDDYSESCLELKARKKDLNEKIEFTNKEVLRLMNQVDCLKTEENSALAVLEYEKSNSTVLKKKLIQIRNDLARLQDSNFEKIKRIEEVRLEIRDFHSREIGSKKTKIKSLILEDCKKLEMIKEENERIGEIINLTEESSRAGSVATMEEVSTNHEDEESLKEYASKLQEQQDRISNLKLELEQKRQEINGEICKCIVL